MLHICSLEIIQIQLLTRRNYPKVYFCTNFENGKKYVLKGPLTQIDKDRIELTEKIKKIIKFPNLNTKVLNLSNQLWLISDSLVNYTNDVIIKESKIESSRPIYNGKNVNCKWEYYFGKNKNILMEPKHMLYATLFKIVIGAKDYASRNYIYSDKKVYSIDDHSYLVDQEIELSNDDITTLPSKGMKKDIKKEWKKFLKLEGYKKILKKLKKWKRKLQKYKKDFVYKNILLDRIIKIESYFVL